MVILSSVVIGLALLVTATNLNHSHHELIIHRDIVTQHCHITRLRRIPSYRRLLTSELDALSFSRIFFIDHESIVEQFTVFAKNQFSLRDQYFQICPKNRDRVNVDEPAKATTDNSQYPFSPLGEPAIPLPPPPPLEFQVTQVTRSGLSSNRVDVTFFSDGYLESERDKFISDVTRLVEEISTNQTFHSVAPLLNFWAAFTPSEESGVGIGGIPKNTPFGLYRDGTELRGLYYAKPAVARGACNSLGDRCDYGVLVGNDPLYGGIGGEFVTITPSIVNGALVLRHELGHSIIGVGEEYDGGFAYFGPNSAQDVNNLPWIHWLTTTLNGSSPPRIERSVMPFQAYPWTILNTSIPWRATFRSSGTYARHLVRFSLSGLPTARQLRVRLDDEDLGWVPFPGIGIDRWHYDIHRPKALNDGQHEVVFELLDDAQQGIAQLCSVEILEFGNEDEFDARPGIYGAFPTFSMDNETSYRPTNEDCLMRLTVSPHFCNACAEALWLALLARVDLFEDAALNIHCSRSHAIIRTNLIPFENREGQPVYEIQWMLNGNTLEDFTNHTEVMLPGDARGEVAVRLRLHVPEVRADPHGLLTAERKGWLSGACAPGEGGRSGGG